MRPDQQYWGYKEVCSIFLLGVWKILWMNRCSSYSYYRTLPIVRVQLRARLTVFTPTTSTVCTVRTVFNYSVFGNSWGNINWWCASVIITDNNETLSVNNSFWFSARNRTRSVNNTSDTRLSFLLYEVFWCCSRTVETPNMNMLSDIFARWGIRLWKTWWIPTMTIATALLVLFRVLPELAPTDETNSEHVRNQRQQLRGLSVEKMTL